MRSDAPGDPPGVVGDVALARGAQRTAGRATARHGPSYRKSANRIAPHTRGCPGPFYLRDQTQLWRRTGRLYRVPAGAARQSTVPALWQAVVIRDPVSL